MKDRALVVAPLPACVGEGRDEVRGEGWIGLRSVHTPCSRNCRDLNHSGEGPGVRFHFREAEGEDAVCPSPANFLVDRLEQIC